MIVDGITRKAGKNYSSGEICSEEIIETTGAVFAGMIIVSQ
jgi:hypothetical protein